jgi:hypothetical protein
LFRNLFIGFLILSALTAKGAGTQVAENNNNTPADTMPGFFGFIPEQAGKTGGLVSSGVKKAFFSRDTIDCKADEPLSGIADEDANLAWFEGICRRDCRPGCVSALPEQVFPFADEAFYCVSGLSPPCFADIE